MVCSVDSGIKNDVFVRNPMVRVRRNCLAGKVFSGFHLARGREWWAGLTKLCRHGRQALE